MQILSPVVHQPSAGRTTSPNFCPAGTEITTVVTARNGIALGSITVDYTMSGGAAVTAGTATWIGAALVYTAPGTYVQKVYTDCWVRVNGVSGLSGSVVVTINPSGNSLTSPENPLQAPTTIPSGATAGAGIDAGTGTLYGPTSLIGTNRPPGQDIGFVGDSFVYNSTGGNNSGLTLTRINGVVTVTGATGHTFYPGSRITVMGCANIADEVALVQVISRLSSSSLTYPSPGPDGVIAAGPQSISIQCPSLVQSAGPWCHFNRLTGGAYRLVANCGISGATLDVVASRVASVMGAAKPHRIIGVGGYNDINGDARTLDQTVAEWVSAVAAYPGVLWDILATSPWNAAAAADSTAHRRQLNRYYLALKNAFKDYQNVRVHNALAIAGDSTTGLAKVGYVKSSDSIHWTWRYCYEFMKYLVALDTPQNTGVDLPVTALDTIAIDAASKNFVDNPLMSGTVAVAGHITTPTSATASGNVPTGVSGQVDAANAVDYAFSLVARADGFGNDIVVDWTPPAGTTTNLRVSLSIPAARFTSGGVIDTLVAKFSLTGLAAGAGNIKSAQMGFVWIAGAAGSEVTYASSVQEASNDTEASVSYSQQDDMTDVTLCMRGIQIPIAASITTGRIDFTVSHYGAGAACQAKIGRVQGKFV